MIGEAIVLGASAGLLALALWARREADRLHRDAMRLVEIADAHKRAGDASYDDAVRAFEDTRARLKEWTTT